MLAPLPGEARHLSRKIWNWKADLALAQGRAPIGEVEKRPTAVAPKVPLKDRGSSVGSNSCDVGKRGEAKKLWRDLFADPSHWRDHRVGKVNSRFPDFKHKEAKKALWLDSEWTPAWVQRKLGAVTPGTIVPSNQRLSRHAKDRQYAETIELFQQTQRLGMSVNANTFLSVLKACAGLRLLEHGRHIHTQIIKQGFAADIFVASSLVDMYAKCGSIDDAWKVFSQMPERDVVAWNAMIMGYVKCGEAHKALDLFQQMQGLMMAPTRVTYLAVLNACAGVAALERGRCVHEEIIRRGFDSEVFLGNCLVDMYAKCGSIAEAECVFSQMRTRDLVAWNSMIVGYVKCGDGQAALNLFHQMQREGVVPDHISFVGVLNACASMAELAEGRRAHEEITRRGYDSDLVVGNCLIDMYTKCGSSKEAERVFGQMPTRDVVAWSSMILGYVKCGEGKKALELFDQMQQEGVVPNPITFVGVLNACASTAALEQGRHAHEEIIRRRYDSDVFLGSCLVDMYAKCGSIEEAEKVFNNMQLKNVVAWTAMIVAYGSHGNGKQALGTFKQMCKFVDVDAVTFVSLLSACSHGGLIEEGLEIFKSMTTVHNISPTVEHYACVVDLLGRAGRLREAEEFIRSMPAEPDATIWLSLLGACRLHGNMKMGEVVAKRVLELDPDNGGAHVLLSNIYAATGK